jgi:hypothetical protein
MNIIDLVNTIMTRTAADFDDVNAAVCQDFPRRGLSHEACHGDSGWAAT